MKTVRKITANSGITLITLVVTIIIILILAGVSISMIIGNNGIVSQGKDSKMKHEIGEYIDRIELARGEKTIDKLGSITLDDLIEKIEYKNKMEQWGIVEIDKLSSEEAEAVTKEGYVITITEKGTEYARLETEPRLPKELLDGDLEINNLIWNAVDNKASVDIIKGENISEKLEIQYQVNAYEENGWKLGTNVTDLNHGDTIYVRLWNGSKGGNYTAFKVKDNISPIVTIDYYNSGTSWINVDVSTRDEQWGMDESPIYTWYIKKTSQPDSEYVKQSCTSRFGYFTGLSQSTSYTVKVEVKDKAQNIGSAILQQTTGTIPTINEHISIGGVTWNSSTHKASVNISAIDITCETILQYQVNGIDEKGWISAEWADKTVTDLNHGDVVYVRLWDGTNAGSYTSVTIKDSILPSAPTISFVSGTAGSNGYYKSNVVLKITEGVDNQSGVKKVTYVLSGATTKTETTITSGSNITISANGTTTVIAYTYDNANNKSSSATYTVKKDDASPTAPTIAFVSGTAGSNGYYKSNIVLKITAGTDSHSNVQKVTYLLSGATTKAETTITSGNSITISADGTTTVTAYTYDNAGNKSSAATYTAKKDATVPGNATITISGATTQSTLPVTLTATVTHSEATSGINIASCKYILNTSSGNIGTSASSYTGGTFSTNGEQITIEPSSATSWYLHVLTVDGAGHAKETIKGPIKVSTSTHSHTGNSTSGGGCYGKKVAKKHSHSGSCYTTCTGKKYVNGSYTEGGTTWYQANCNKCGAYEGKTSATTGYACGASVLSCGKTTSTVESYTYTVNCGITAGAVDGYNITY